uniref:Uncharacterized protein n=1 Tax=Rhizophora mucronata TaxID=61149 RepID=A0A2P2PV34_RHIMU
MLMFVLGTKSTSHLQSAIPFFWVLVLIGDDLLLWINQYPL